MSDLITRTVLTALRKQFDMDVAFISEFREGNRVFRFVDTEDETCPVEVDGSDPLEATYCQRVVDGRLPELMRDANTFQAARELPVTEELPVGAHLSVPIRRSNGRIFGTLCCFSYTPNQNLGYESVRTLRALADFVGFVLEENETEHGDAMLIRSRITRLLASAGGPQIVFQPIVQLRSRTPVGLEALSRFPDGRAPDQWFAEAWDHDIGIALEHAAIRRAIEEFRSVPEPAYLSVNLSPDTLSDPTVLETLYASPTERLVVEVTEHAAVEKPSALRELLRGFRSRGGRVAIDDVGAGFSGLHHLVELAPDIIKLDRSLITGVDTHLARQAIVASLVTYARAVGASVVAEGIETEDEFCALVDLGVENGQGYHLGRPTDVSQIRL